MKRYVGIDPSTKTGFVALDEHGQVLRAKELAGIGAKDPKRMRTMIVDIIGHMKKDDFVCIEGFGFASQQAIQNGGIGWGIRMSLEAKGFNYHEVAPNALKKFVNVTDWKGEPGSKVRLKANEKKKAVMQSVLEHYGFKHKSDNVVDAYVLAQIARHIHQGAEALTDKPYQLEVVQTILNPPVKKKKVKKGS
ncbi:hypothetical protein M3689_00985 [Alkalihalophilus marmarensis]|uniref:hypothetical protein n=1 Tax=Alkalihalophilus marmarensis TaxID=521377 RepID=UPI00203D5D10|nr:hypothetical protein [Alkalihalophilus marmarensis]MCM3487874.1 hypothetical protein [Alkalihalophilus marmarensis]